MVTENRVSIVKGLPINQLARHCRWIVLLLAVMLLTACSYAYKLQVTIIPGEQVDSKVINEVNIIIVKAPHQPSELSSMPTLPVGEEGVLITEICCTPDPDIWVYAFHDANGSDRWDSNEPLVIYSDNPIRLTDDYTMTLAMP